MKEGWESIAWNGNSWWKNSRSAYWTGMLHFCEDCALVQRRAIVVDAVPSLNQCTAPTCGQVPGSQLRLLWIIGTWTTPHDLYTSRNQSGSGLGCLYGPSWLMYPTDVLFAAGFPRRTPTRSRHRSAGRLPETAPTGIVGPPLWWAGVRCIRWFRQYRLCSKWNSSFYLHDGGGGGYMSMADWYARFFIWKWKFPEIRYYKYNYLFSNNFKS